MKDFLKDFKEIIKLISFICLGVIFLTYMILIFHRIIQFLKLFIYFVWQGFISLSAFGVINLVFAICFVLLLYLYKEKLYNKLNKIEQKANDFSKINAKFQAIIFFIGVYIVLSIVGLIFYRASGGELVLSNKSDIINIFIWATYLLAPIVVIWAFSDWKVEFRDREKYQSLKELEEKVITIKETFIKLDKMIMLNWDEKAYKIANLKYMQSFFERTEFINIFFKPNQLSNLETNFLDIMKKDNSKAMVAYNEFVFSRSKFHILENDIKFLKEFDSEILYSIKSKLAQAATMLSSENLLEAIDGRISIGQPNDWIVRFRQLKEDVMTVDFVDFNSCTEQLLNEIKLMKESIINT